MSSSPVSFWHCHRPDGSAGGHRGRGQQHLRRTPLLPAGRADLAYGREMVANKVFHVSPFCHVQGLPLPLHAHGPALRGPHRPRRRPRAAAADQRQRALQPLTAPAVRAAFFGMPLMTLGVLRASTGRRCNCGSSVCPSSASRRRRRPSSHVDYHPCHDDIHRPHPFALPQAAPAAARAVLRLLAQALKCRHARPAIARRLAGPLRQTARRHARRCACTTGACAAPC
jgi:hypothetical protein